jgi:uncharacterized membrane protein YhfC
MRSVFARFIALTTLFCVATHLTARAMFDTPVAIYTVVTLGLAMSLAVLWAWEAKSQRDRRRTDDMRDSALW